MPQNKVIIDKTQPLSANPEIYLNCLPQGKDKIPDPIIASTIYILPAEFGITSNVSELLDNRFSINNVIS